MTAVEPEPSCMSSAFPTRMPGTSVIRLRKVSSQNGLSGDDFQGNVNWLPKVLARRIEHWKALSHSRGRPAARLHLEAAVGMSAPDAQRHHRGRAACRHVEFFVALRPPPGAALSRLSHRDVG